MPIHRINFRACPEIGITSNDATMVRRFIREMEEWGALECLENMNRLALYFSEKQRMPFHTALKRLNDSHPDLTEKFNSKMEEYSRK